MLAVQNSDEVIEVSNSQQKLGATLLLLVFHLSHQKNARLSRIFFQDL